MRTLLEPILTRYKDFEFETNMGCPQGATISPILFNLYLDEVLKQTMQNVGIKTTLDECCLAFADDIVFYHKEPLTLVRIIKSFEYISKQWNINIGVNKCSITTKQKQELV